MRFCKKFYLMGHQNYVPEVKVKSLKKDLPTLLIKIEGFRFLAFLMPLEIKLYTVPHLKAETG